ncbi:MAG TPA: hypothetical protein VD867_09390 [Burkholderiales bacterium]|nr:hypothetical protein [Burkholderiales bacterium]
MHHQRSFLSLIVVLGAALVAVAAALAWPEGTTHFMREDGPVENASAVFYILGVAAAWSARHPAYNKASAAAVSIVLIVCFAREVSLRRQLLAAAGFNASGNSMSAWPNLIAAALVVALVPALIWLIWRYWRVALDGLLRRETYALTLVVALLCIVAAEGFDHALKVDHDNAALAASRLHAVAFALEETLEMMFPILLFLSAHQTRVRWRLPWRS